MKNTTRSFLSVGQSTGRSRRRAVGAGRVVISPGQHVSLDQGKSFDHQFASSKFCANGEHMIYHRGTISAREAGGTFSRAYYANLDELIAAGRHPDDAAWEARRHAVQAQEREASAKDAALNAAVLAALKPIQSTTKQDRQEPPSNIVDFDWDAAIAHVNR